MNYDLIETYSFKRGPKLLLELTKSNFNLNETSLIIGTDGRFDITAEKKTSFRKETDDSTRFSKIINTPLNEVPYWMCAPFYRDALIFRDNENRIINTLNICFECSYIQDQYGNFIDADQNMYDELQLFLKSLGHEIQKNESIDLRYKIRELKR
jgi:hypothetical protein